jgi:hypothetical protein
LGMVVIWSAGAKKNRPGGPSAARARRKEGKANASRLARYRRPVRSGGWRGLWDGLAWRLGWVGWELEVGGGAAVGLTFQPEPGVIDFGQAVGPGQAEAAATTGLAVREERIEGFLQDVGGHAASVIFQGEDDGVIGQMGAAVYGQVEGIGGGGVEGVGEEFVEDLAEVGGVGVGGWEARGAV